MFSRQTWIFQKRNIDCTLSFLSGSAYPHDDRLIQSVISRFVSLSKCSAQGQVLHCKRRNQGCNSAEDGFSTANSGTKVAVTPKGRSSTANSGTKVAVLSKGGLPLKTQEPMLQFCPSAGLPL